MRPHPPKTVTGYDPTTRSAGVVKGGKSPPAPPMPKGIAPVPQSPKAGSLAEILPPKAAGAPKASQATRVAAPPPSARPAPGKIPSRPAPSAAQPPQAPIPTAKPSPRSIFGNDGKFRQPVPAKGSPGRVGR